MFSDSCFTDDGCRIVMADGSLRVVTEIREGDMVRSILLPGQIYDLAHDDVETARSLYRASVTGQPFQFPPHEEKPPLMPVHPKLSPVSFSSPALSPPFTTGAHVSPFDLPWKPERVIKVLHQRNPGVPIALSAISSQLDSNSSPITFHLTWGSLSVVLCCLSFLVFSSLCRLSPFLFSVRIGPSSFVDVPPPLFRLPLLGHPIYCAPFLYRNTITNLHPQLQPDMMGQSFPTSLFVEALRSTAKQRCSAAPSASSSSSSSSSGGASSSFSMILPDFYRPDELLVPEAQLAPQLIPCMYNFVLSGGHNVLTEGGVIVITLGGRVGDRLFHRHADLVELFGPPLIERLMKSPDGEIHLGGPWRCSPCALSLPASSSAAANPDDCISPAPVPSAIDGSSSPSNATISNEGNGNNGQQQPIAG